MSEQTESRAALLLPIRGNRLPNAPVSDGAARSTESYFRDGWHLRDERLLGVPTLLRTGIADDLDCVPAELIAKHPYYQEFLAPAGLRWFAGVRMGMGDDIWCLSIQRGIDQAPFSPEEKAKLTQLSRSLSTVVTFALALGSAASSAVLDAFDVSQTAAILLNRQAEVIRTNRTADRLLMGEVRISGERLTAPDTAATAALDRALHRLLWAPSGASLMPAIPLPRTGQMPILAYPLKLPSLSASAMAAAQAAVVLIDPSARGRPIETSLRAAFRLTPAAARLATLLASGDPLESICEQLGISKETGRNQLKSIFAKTGTNRQAELVLAMAKML
ncbi:helix-turn-helix transcriptional regulator [Bradyrhizobium sp. STM 3562]|uniref:helix-turn-helix transcriptional regulator n=1 Tax=Bradyrhizobium sp. STM 3562 TaxID=578924 RepID=UPI00388CF871